MGPYKYDELFLRAQISDESIKSLLPENLHWVQPLFKSGNPDLLELATNGLGTAYEEGTDFLSEAREIFPDASGNSKDILVSLWSTLHGGWPGEQLYRLQSVCLWVLSKFAMSDTTHALKKEILKFGLSPVLELFNNPRLYLQSDAMG